MAEAARKDHNSEPLFEARRDAREWALRLFGKSPLKQRKLQKLLSHLGSLSTEVCLDIGSDNGVISLLLRERGGFWYSADLIPETVASIQSLVGERVSQITGQSTGYEESHFDVVAIVDFLEHIETDQDFVLELSRIIKPGGVLIANVPNPKEGVFRALKNRIGQTDKAHGHVRPGYTLRQLQELFHGYFEIETSESYSRFFSDLIDTVITFALDCLKPGGRGQKGTVVTGSDLEKMKKSFRLYSLIYPVIWLFVKLDMLIPFTHGNMLIVRAKSLKSS